MFTITTLFSQPLNIGTSNHILEFDSEVIITQFKLKENFLIFIYPHKFSIWFWRYVKGGSGEIYHSKPQSHRHRIEKRNKYTDNSQPERGKRTPKTYEYKKLHIIPKMVNYIFKLEVEIQRCHINQITFLHSKKELRAEISFSPKESLMESSCSARLQNEKKNTIFMQMLIQNIYDLLVTNKLRAKKN